MEYTLIKVKTAKLAKEKGFDWGCSSCYDPTYGVLDDLCIFNRKANWNSEQELHSAPTQSLLQKWLREVHKIYVTPRESLSFDNIMEFVCTVNDRYVNHGIFDKPVNRFDTCEEALEEGLYQALLLIENK